MKKRRYQPKDFESLANYNRDTSANIYYSMMTSEIFKSLTKQQQILYVYMKMRYYCSSHPGKINEQFYFNKHLWHDEYNLYKNANSFYKDRDALVEKGFIDIVERGWNTRTKAIYRYSSRWQSKELEIKAQKHKAQNSDR